MLAAKALTALAVRAAKEGDVDEAVTRANEALDIPRQSIPSLVSSSADVISALNEHEGRRRVPELSERLTALVGRTDS